MSTGTFEEYIESLREEAERGSAPNHNIAIGKFIKVSDNIISRIAEINPVESMLRPY
jgi:hypothetical protein